MHVPFALGLIALWLAVIAGWVMNLVAIVTTANSGVELGALFIARCAGVLIVPLGAILGWFV